MTLLPAVLAARLLGVDTSDLDYLAREGLVPSERRTWRTGGLLAAPHLQAVSR